MPEEIPLGPVLEVLRVNTVPDPVTVGLLLEEGPDAPMDETDAEPVLVVAVPLEEVIPVPLVLEEEIVTPDGPRDGEDEMGLPVAPNEPVVGTRLDGKLRTLVPELVVPVTDDALALVVPEMPDTGSELVGITMPEVKLPIPLVTLPITELRVPVALLTIPDVKLPTLDVKLPTLDVKLPTFEVRLPTAELKGLEFVAVAVPVTETLSEVAVVLVPRRLDVRLPTPDVKLPTTELRGLELEVVVAPVAETIAVELMEDITPVPEADRTELTAVPVTDSPVLVGVAAVSVFEVV